MIKKFLSRANQVLEKIRSYDTYVVIFLLAVMFIVITLSRQDKLGVLIEAIYNLFN